MKLRHRKTSASVFILLWFALIFAGAATIWVAILYIDNDRAEQGKSFHTFKSAVNSVRDYPNDSNSHSALASVYQREKKYSQAVAEYRIAIRLEPNEATWHFYLGEAFKQSGDNYSAIRELRRAIQLDVEGGWVTGEAQKLLKTTLP